MYLYSLAIKTVTALLLGLPAALALPHLHSRDLSTWSPPAGSDVRSPCPALNALANHGILPHSGQNITRDMLIDAFSVINVDAGVSGGLFLGADKLGLLDDGILNLDNLNKHNGIEHDGSLSRADFFDGDNHSFNQDFFDEYISNFEGLDTITLSDAAKARFARIKSDMERNPEMTYGFAQQFFSNGETALLMGGLGDATIGEVPIDYLKIFFRKLDLSHLLLHFPSYRLRVATHFLK